MMARLADLDAIVTEERHLTYLRSVLSEIDAPPVVLVTDADAAVNEAGATLGMSELEQFDPLRELPPLLSDEIAYLLFTSGSTGIPKGVPVAHSNVCHFLDVMQARYRLHPDDRLSQTFDQTFDLSVFDLFMAWQAGGSVHVPSTLDLVAPTSFVNRSELTVWFSVPSIPALMRKKQLLKAGSLPSLRWSLFCGEPLPRATAEEWQAAAPNSVLENLYGPTELTIACFAYRWDPETSPAECVNDLVPIGRPYPGLGAVVVDDERRAVVDGQPGELLVCGPQTVPGYWRAPEKTEERFLPLGTDLGTAGSEARFYATGDRVIRSEEGCYAYLGRTDQQVKVLGYRVELGEIEACIRAVEGVVDAIAIPWPVEDGVAQGIVAVISGSDDSARLLVDRARTQLPSYMTPERVAIVDDMPLNANGKIDRNALRDGIASGAIAF
jgi:amino acid adenylation domain-containing protein